MGITAAPEPALAGTGLDDDRRLIRLGVAAAVCGMLAWIIGMALIPPQARLEQGSQHLAQVLQAHAAPLYAAALLAASGAALLAGFFAVLSCLVSRGRPGWAWLRVSLAGCVITQTLVAAGAGFALAGVHGAAANAPAGVVALAWRGVWLTFLVSAVPTIMFTATGVAGLHQARLSPPWVSALGWLSATAHLLVMFTLAQRGAFTPDGIIATLAPLTTVIWILALAATLPRSWPASRAVGPGDAVAISHGESPAPPAEAARSRPQAGPAATYQPAHGRLRAHDHAKASSCSPTSSA